MNNLTGFALLIVIVLTLIFLFCVGVATWMVLDAIFGTPDSKVMREEKKAEAEKVWWMFRSVRVFKRSRWGK